MAFPEVKDVLTEQGHPEDGTDDEAPNQSETFVIMKPRGGVAHRARTKEQVIDAMRAELEQRPGVDYNFSQPIKDRVEESISGIRGQIVVKIYGDDLALMHEKLERGRSDHQRARAARATSTSTAPAPRSTSSPTSIARRRRATACRCATSRTRSRARSAACWRPRVGGRAAGRRAREDCRRRRGRPGAVGRLEVPAEDDARCRWRRWRTCTSTAAARRSTASRAGASWRSSATSKGATWAASSTRRRRASRATVKLPEGYHLTWGGEFENQRRAMKRLPVIVPISVLRDLLAPLPDLPRGAAGAGRAARRAVRDRGRRLRAVPDAHRAVGVGGGRLHHAVRRGGDERRAAGHLHPARAREDGRDGQQRCWRRCPSACGRC